MSKKKKKAPEGAPEWMVTFGDLMSLLLTFFVLLFSISEIKSEKIFDVVVAFRTEFEMKKKVYGFREHFDAHGQLTVALFTTPEAEKNYQWQAHFITGL